MKFTKSADNQWQSRPQRGFIGTIDFNPAGTPPTGRYTLTVDSGVGVIGDFTTLRKAKNAFRKFLRDKPVL